MRVSLLCLLLASPVLAEEDLAATLEPIRKKYRLPAMGAAIVRGDKVTAIGATGVRKLGDKTKVTKDDLWHLGSCTKSMTATLVGRFVERGEIAWDTTLKAALPKIKPRDVGWDAVTIGLLLRNRGGAPADLSRDGLWGELWKRKGTPTAQRAQLVRGVMRHAPIYEPGSKYVYANAGFAMAGYALEAKTGKSWETLMRAELFKPLGMKSAGFGAPGKKLDQPWGHQANGTPMTPGPGADNPAAIGPAGIVHASLRDWGRYIALHLQGAQEGEKPLLLKRETLRHIQTAKKGETYAMGWGVGTRPWAGGPVLSHSGSNTMWYCVVWIAPKKDFAVLVTCNQGGPVATKACDDASGALIRLATAKPAGK